MGPLKRVPHHLQTPCDDNKILPRAFCFKTVYLSKSNLSFSPLLSAFFFQVSANNPGMRAPVIVRTT